jgi:Protein of unknown function (DUF4446)
MDADVAGIVAIAAGALAVAGVIWGAILARRLRQLRGRQSVVLGNGDPRDLVAHASELEQRLLALADEVSGSVERLDSRDADLSRRLQGAVSRCSVVRYDAMGEMTGRQSSSVALLDAAGNGVVMSSILHREQARLYAKQIVGGRSELELSHEEQQALRTAMGSRPSA